MAQRRLGLFKDALKSHRAALEIRTREADKTGEASTRHALALVYEEIGENEKALTFYEWALRLRREVMDRPGEAVTCYNLAKLYLRIGYLQEGEALMARAVEIEELTGHPDHAKDEVELAAIREKRRAAGLPNPVGDTSGKYPKIILDAEPKPAEGSTVRHAAIKYRPSTKQ
jgi:tetratricopeptide (TPR) repeat protein